MRKAFILSGVIFLVSLFLGAGTYPYTQRPMSRSNIMARAHLFYRLHWHCSEDNAYGTSISGATCPYGTTDGWKDTMPYCWGGDDDVYEFLEKMTAGKGAGDRNTSSSSPYYSGHVGSVDCSGYVSQLWRSGRYTTRSFPNVSNDVGWENLAPGDAINRSGHIRLNAQYPTGDGTILVYESTGTGWRMQYRTLAYDETYDGIRYHYVSERPSLIALQQNASDGVKVQWYGDIGTGYNDPNSGFSIYYKFPGGTWNQAHDRLDAHITEANVSGLLTGQLYYFQVRAHKPGSVTTYSNIVPVILKPGTYYETATKPVLLVDGYERYLRDESTDPHSLLTHFGQALHYAGVPFDMADNVMISRELLSLEEYETVIWMHGEESTAENTFNHIEMHYVMRFLENGGNLFVSGSEIGWDMVHRERNIDNLGALDREELISFSGFYNNYLKAGYIGDGVNGNGYQASGLNGTIFEGLTIIFDDGTQGTYNVQWADRIEAYGEGTLNLQYASGHYGGIEYQGTFGDSNLEGKLVYMAIPFETIYPQSSANQVMERIIDFFSGDPVTIPFTDLFDDEDYSPYRLRVTPPSTHSNNHTFERNFDYTQLPSPSLSVPDGGNQRALKTETNAYDDTVQWMEAEVGDGTWTDYSVEWHQCIWIDDTQSTNTTEFAGIGVRTNGLDSGYYFLVRSNTSDIWGSYVNIYRSYPGVVTPAHQTQISADNIERVFFKRGSNTSWADSPVVNINPEPGGDPIGATNLWVHYKVTVEQDQISFYVNDMETPVWSYQDPEPYLTGNVMLFHDSPWSGSTGGHDKLLSLYESISITPLKTATPVLSPVPGTYTSPQEITISCSTPEATIHYTIDGTDPATSATAQSGNPGESVQVSVPMNTARQIRAYATHQEWSDSEEVSGMYIVQPALTGLQIEGPSSLALNSSYQYHARAFYNDGTDSIVSADWELNFPGTEVFFSDDFNYAGQAEFESEWYSDNSSLLLSTDQFRSTKSVSQDNTARANYYDLPSGYQGSNDNPLIFEFWMYDSAPDMTSARHFISLAAYSDGSWGEGTLENMLAFGLHPPSGDYYNARILYGADNWVLTSAERTEGWRKMTIKIYGSQVAFYVDDTLAYEAGYTVPLTGWNSVRLGSGLSSSDAFTVYYDDLSLYRETDTGGALAEIDINGLLTTSSEAGEGILTASYSQSGITQTDSINITISDDTGELAVIISPQQAIDEGAQWSIDGGATWFDSGTRVVAAGIYTITFKEIEGWTGTPDDIIGVEVHKDGLTTEYATYIQKTSVRDWFLYR